MGRQKPSADFLIIWKCLNANFADKDWVTVLGIITYKEKEGLICTYKTVRGKTEKIPYIFTLILAMVEKLCQKIHLT